MPQQIDNTETIAAYPPGSLMWRSVNPRQRDCWQSAIVIEHHDVNTYHYGMTVKNVGKKNTSVLSDWNIRWEAMPRKALPARVLCDTGIGHRIGRTMQRGFTFGVWECTDKVRWAGKTLGYLIVPGEASQCSYWSGLPSFKYWNVGPNATELLHFLAERMPEIFATNQQLTQEFADVQKAKHPNSIEAA